MAVLHRAHKSGFCSALEQLSHSVALLLSLCRRRLNWGSAPHAHYAVHEHAQPLRLRPWHLESLGNLVKREAAWANGVADGGAERRRRALLRPAADVTPAHA